MDLFNVEDDIIICRCKKVSKNTIVDVIKNGADTYEKVKAETQANKYGCMGCRLKVNKLIETNK